MKYDYEIYEVMRASRNEIRRHMVILERISSAMRLGQGIKDLGGPIPAEPSTLDKLDALLDISFEEECELYKTSDHFKRGESLKAELNKLRTGE